MIIIQDRDLFVPFYSTGSELLRVFSFGAAQRTGEIHLQKERNITRLEMKYVNRLGNKLARPLICLKN